MNELSQLAMRAHLSPGEVSNEAGKGQAYEKPGSGPVLEGMRWRQVSSAEKYGGKYQQKDSY